MRFTWIDDFVKEGKIRPEIATKIDEDVDEVVKIASVPSELPKFKQFLERFVQPILSSMAGTAAGSYIGYTVAKTMDRAEDKAQAQALLKNREVITSAMPIKDDKEKAGVRFDEIANIAPSVAAHPALSQRLVKDRLNSGLTDKDVDNLASLQATYVANKVPQRVESILEKSSSIRPEILGNIMADVYLTVIPEFEKIASKGQIVGKLIDWPAAKRLLGTFGMYTAGGLAASAIGGGIRSLMDKMDKKKLKENLEKSFQMALERSNPEREPLRDNPDKARQAFESLVHFSPSVAVQPDAARAFMSRIVSYDQGLTTGDVRDLSEIEKNLANSAKPSPFVEGFQQAALATGLSKVVPKAIEEAAKMPVKELQRQSQASYATQLGKSSKDLYRDIR